METDNEITGPNGLMTGGNTLATYVYGLYIDEPLQMRRKGAPGAPDSVYYFHRDDLYSLAALTDSTGAVAERYDYGDYGEPTFLNPDGSVQLKAGSTTEASNSSAVNNRYLFTGREWDPELNLYFYRSRYYDPRMGRFTQVDSIGVWGDGGNVGNGYSYVGANPLARLDPKGDYTTVRVGFLGWTQEPTEEWGKVLSSYKAKIFDSLQVGEAFRYIKANIDTNNNGVYDKCDEDARVGIAGYSWGGWSTLELSHRINDKLMDKKKGDNEVDAELASKLYLQLGFLDPVESWRTEENSINLSLVDYAVNVYETYGKRNYIRSRTFRGEFINGADVNLNVTGIGGSPDSPDHVDLGYEPKWNRYAKYVAQEAFTFF